MCSVAAANRAAGEQIGGTNRDGCESNSLNANLTGSELPELAPCWIIP